jgi:hypothetical protein
MWWNQFPGSMRHHDAVIAIKLVILEPAALVDPDNLKFILIWLCGSKISHGISVSAKIRFLLSRSVGCLTRLWITL